MFTIISVLTYSILVQHLGILNHCTNIVTSVNSKMYILQFTTTVELTKDNSRVKSRVFKQRTHKISLMMVVNVTSKHAAEIH